MGPLNYEGPTATGKSSIALELCKQLDGELVSCDSVQVYRNLSIGCNKPSEEDMKEVRHHLVNIAALSETFTAGKCQSRLNRHAIYDAPSATECTPGDLGITSKRAVYLFVPLQRFALQEVMRAMRHHFLFFSDQPHKHVKCPSVPR